MRHNFSYKEQAFNAPSKWDEVSARDLLTIAKVTAVQDKSRVFNDLLICYLFNIPKSVYKQLKPGERYELSALVKWISQKNTIQKWLLSAVRIGSVKLYGPKHRLANITAEEFMYCEAAYERWLHTGKNEYLDTLFAVLYRRKWFFSTYRQKFNSDKLQKHEARAAKLKNFVKKAVALNYAGCRNLIIDKHKYIWTKAQEHSKETNAGNKQPVTNWGAIILDLAGDKFGTYDQTLRTNIWLVLADLDKKVKTVKEMEAPR